MREFRVSAGGYGLLPKAKYDWPLLLVFYGSFDDFGASSVVTDIANKNWVITSSTAVILPLFSV